MLEFIVLGQIPGTSVQITISWVVVILACVLIGTEYRMLQPHPAMRKKKTTRPQKA